MMDNSSPENSGNIAPVDFVDDQIVAQVRMSGRIFTESPEQAFAEMKAEHPVGGNRTITFDKVFIAIGGMKAAHPHQPSLGITIAKNQTSFLFCKLIKAFLEGLTGGEFPRSPFSPVSLAGARRSIQNHLAFALENLLNLSSDTGKWS
jgi:hypothetical protein